MIDVEGLEYFFKLKFEADGNEAMRKALKKSCDRTWGKKGERFKKADREWFQIVAKIARKHKHTFEHWSKINYAIKS